MVALTLFPYRGNQNTRFFPYSGFLGLTPVIVQGQIRTALEEDRRPLSASSVCVRVRCYEADTVGAKTKGKEMHLLYDMTQEIWSSGGDGWKELGDLVRPFRIVLPVTAEGATTTTFKNYRVWWQVEAVIKHKECAVLGSRTIVAHRLPLTRFSNHTPPSFSSPSWSSAPRTPPTGADRGLSYSIDTLAASYGPLEPIKTIIRLSKGDPSLQVRRIQISLDRHITVESSGSHSGSDTDDIVVPDDEPLYSPFLSQLPDTPSSFESKHSRRTGSKGITSVFKRMSSTPGATTPGGKSVSPESTSYFQARPALPSNSSSSIHVWETEEIGWNGCESEVKMVAPVPKSKSMYRYSVGESMRSKYTRVHFTLSVKISIKTKAGGSEVIELEPRPVHITGVSEADRARARGQAARVFPLADAELRQFETSPDAYPSPPFSTTSDSDYNWDCESKEGLCTPPDVQRRRSDPNDEDTPVKSRPRYTPTSPEHRTSSRRSASAGGYVPSALSRPPVSQHSSLTPEFHESNIHDPSPASHIPFRSSAFPLSLPSAGQQEAIRHLRRAGRSGSRHSPTARPRSDSAVSTVSHQSWREEGSMISDVSSIVSSRSGASSTRHGRYTRDTSATPSVPSPPPGLVDPLLTPSFMNTSIDSLKTLSAFSFVNELGYGGAPSNYGTSSSLDSSSVALSRLPRLFQDVAIPTATKPVEEATGRRRSTGGLGIFTSPKVREEGKGGGTKWKFLRRTTRV